jgi:outer membrane receptor protein involved in Fe transport
MLAGSSLMALAMLAAPLSAQDSSAQIAAPAAQPAAASPSAAGEIIVTANKRAQNINDVGLSITALSGAALVQKGIASSQDLAKVVPAFTVAAAADGTPVYTLRGVGFNSANLGAQPTVSVYNDQAALPYGPMTEGPLFDLERLEVLKGPQGTLFGQNSTGGAINYIANKPTSTTTYGITGSFSRFNMVQGEAFISGPVTGTMSARLAIAGTRADDWQYDYTRKDGIGKQRKVAARFLLDWDPSDRLKVSLNLNGWIDRSDNQIPQFLVASPRVASQASPLLFTQPAAPHNDRAADWDPNHSFQRNNRFGQAVLRLDYKLTDQFTLTSLSNYQYVHIDSPFDNDGTQYSFGYVTTSGHVESFNQELRASGKIGAATITFGGNYSTDNSFESDFQDFGGLLSSTTNVGATPANPAGAGTILFNQNRGYQKNHSYAGFGNIEYEITPKLTVLGGVRYTSLFHSNQACSADTGGGDFSNTINGLFGGPVTQPGGCITLEFNGTGFDAPFPVQTFKEHNVSWRAGLNYKPSKDSLLYVLVSRGYKAGNYPIINATARSQFQPVKQEKLTDYEAGFKLGLFDRKVQLNASGYYYDYRNKQLLTNTTDPIFGLLPVLANVPKSRVIGFDADVTVNPVTGLTLRGAVGYADSKIKSFQGFDAFNTPADLSGKPFNFSPKWTSTADVEYRLPVSDRIDAFVGGDMTYNSSTYSDLAQTSVLKIKSYSIFGARAGVSSHDGRWSASIWGKNVFNKYYWYNVQVGYDSVWRLNGMPATYGVTLSYRM